MSLWPFPPPVATMEARVSERWPKGSFAYEPKWDGFRALAWSGPQPRLDSRNQRPLLRYFPELLPAVEQLPPGTVVDGEVVVVHDNATRFDALQMRIHPAQSRITRLSEEIPAQLVAFDLLAAEGKDLRSWPFSIRRRLLETLAAGLTSPWNLTPTTTDQSIARLWFDEYEAAGCDGVVAKRLDGEYESGKRGMIKIKHRRHVDCVVGGYRVHKDGGKIGSLLLGLYNSEGALHFIGHCSGFPDTDRARSCSPCSRVSAPPSPLVKRRGRQAASADGQPKRACNGRRCNREWWWKISYDQLEKDRFRHATRFHRMAIRQDPPGNAPWTNWRDPRDRGSRRW